MVLNFAHRGFSGQFPENTMLAFQKAIDAGCDGIELDVQLSKDRIPVIIHDELLERTTGAAGRVGDYTLEELKNLNAPAAFGSQFGKTEIPTLEEYFQGIGKTGIITNIELKNSIEPYQGMERIVWDLIRRFHMEKRVIISSFNHYSLLEFKRLAPKMPCGVLEESRMVNAAGYASGLGMEYLHPIYAAVTPVYAGSAAALGLGIHAWTVNDKEEMKRLIELGVRGIIGNHPDLAANVISSYEKQL